MTGGVAPDGPIRDWAGAGAPSTSSPGRMTPAAAELVQVDLPETLRYRLKNRLLGPPLVNEQLSGERLGRPSALGVLSPDCISS